MFILVKTCVKLSLLEVKRDLGIYSTTTPKQSIKIQLFDFMPAGEFSQDGMYEATY